MKFNMLTTKIKPQKLSINNVIIAIIILVIIVALILVLTSRVGLFPPPFVNCESERGQCQPSESSTFSSCPDDKAYVPNTECEKKNPKEICCVQLISRQ